MAKKKRDRGLKLTGSKNWTSVYDNSHKPDYSKSNQLNDLLKWYEQQTLSSVRCSPRETRDQMRMLDMDELWLKRRTEAIKKTMPEICKLATKICPTVPGQFYIEEDWGQVNYAPITSYDGIDNRLDLTMGAAIWMLDQIKANGHMDSAICELPKMADIPDEVFDHVNIYDAVHSVDVIESMMAAIRYRNRDCVIPEKYDKYREEQPGKTFADIVTVLKKQHQKVPSRLLFESLLGMVGKEKIDAAVKLYKNKLYEWITLYFKARAVLREEEVEWEQRKNRLMDGCSRNPYITTYVNDKPVRQLPFAKGMTQGATALETFQKNLSTFDPYMNPEFLRDEIEEIDKQFHAMTSRVEDLVFAVGDVSRNMETTLRESHGDRIADIMCNFKIEDPYAMCFAMMYEFDSGRDLPWLYFPGNAVAEHVRLHLPWTRYMRVDPVIENDYAAWLSDDDEETNDCESSVKGNGAKISALPDMFDIKYVCHAKGDDVEQDVSYQANLAQILYGFTGGILPRNFSRYYNAIGDMLTLGIKDEATIKQMLYCIMLLGESQFKADDESLRMSYEDDYDDKFDACRADEADDIIDEALYQPEEANKEPEKTAEQYEAEIKALKKELDLQKQQAYEATRAKRDLQGKYDALVEQNDFERKELAELREVVYNIEQQQTSGKPVQEEEITFPYTVKHTIVVFGGHDTWAKAIKPMFDGDIRFIFRDKLPDDNLIRHADMVWVQTNCISHPNHWKISRAAQASKVPVHHFAFASAEKCARQIIEADKALDSTNQ